MKRFFCLPIVLFFMFVLEKSLLAEAIISVTPDVLVGNVRERGIKVFTFTIHNTGDSDLIIQQVKKSCGCTMAFLEKNIIPPAKFSKLKVVYSHEGNSNIFLSNILIKSNSSIDPDKLLKIKGNIYKETFFVPTKVKLKMPLNKRVILGDVNLGSQNEKAFHITSCKVGDFFYDDKLLDTQVLMPIIEGDTVVFKPLKPNLKSGEYFTVLYLDVKTEGDIKKYELLVEFVVTPPLMFYPECLELNIYEDSSIFQNRILVKSDNDIKYEMVSVESPVDWVNTSVKKIDDTTSFVYVKTMTPKNIVSLTEIPLVVRVKIANKVKEIKYLIKVNPIKLTDSFYPNIAD